MIHLTVAQSGEINALYVFSGLGYAQFISFKILYSTDRNGRCPFIKMCTRGRL